MASSITEWVQDNAPHITRISVSECAELCLKVIHNARIEDAVSFYANSNTFD